MVSERFRLGRAVVGRKGLRWHRSGHPWLFRDDLLSLEDVPTHLCRVEDERGVDLGLAASSSRSKIGLRFVDGPRVGARPAREGEPESTDGSEPVTAEARQAWFARRIDAAIERRRPLEAETDACRMVASDGDGIPGLLVDRYADILVLQALTPFVDSQLDLIVPVLVDRLGPRMVLARNDLRVRALEGLESGVELLHGRRVAHVEIQEHGIRSVVDPWTGQKTGAFLDQRPARKLVMERASGRVLDLFCYQGGFALHARRGGATSVLAVDASAAAIEEVVAASKRNGLDGIEARRGKAVPVLQELIASRASFDGVIVDPPAFAKSKAELEAATRGYVELNAKAMRVVAPGGWVVTCSCSYALRAEAFKKILAEAARRAGRSFVDRGRIPPAIDHPVRLGLPEADYLQAHFLVSLD